MSQLIRVAGLLTCLLVASVPAASGANQKEIERSLKGGVASLKARYARGGAPVVGSPDATNNFGIGGTCLTGLALLEAGTPANDPVIKTITEFVRTAAYTQTNTYYIALCLMYLDRLGEKADEPLIQALAVRLLVAQTSGGGWGYTCIGIVSADDVKRLRAMKADHQPGQLHPEVKLYWQALVAAKGQAGMGMAGDDNSNTQFGLLAVWMSRKHGVPVDPALDLVEKRFMASQDARTGNWSYNLQPNSPAAGAPGSPAMYCAGLLGMATGVARREAKPKDPPANPKPDAPAKPAKPTDPFYNPPAGKESGKESGKEPEKKLAARPASAQDLVIQRAFAGLGLTLADLIRGGRLLAQNAAHGHGDLYFLWSMERVGVVYGIDKIGGLDWFDLGSTAIVRSQLPDGSWGAAGNGVEVNTAFAVLFLSRSNLARDLSSKVQKDPTNTEMRAGSGPSPTDLLPNRPVTTPANPLPVLELPNPTGDEGIMLASKLLKSTGADWTKLLTQARDAKGATNTRALVLTATNTADYDRKKQVREALAERLCRMTPDTLRTMMKSEQSELRRAAALACAMKDDRSHIAELIELITDPDDSVTRAAKAGLKSLTGKDFGPEAEASAGQKALAATAWKEWFAKEKK
jgi:hypothetical protein